MIVTTMTVKINSDDRDAIVSDDYTYGDEEFNHLIPNMLAIWMTSQRRNAWVQLRSDMASQRRVGIQLARGNSSNIWALCYAQTTLTFDKVDRKLSWRLCDCSPCRKWRSFLHLSWWRLPLWVVLAGTSCCQIVSRVFPRGGILVALFQHGHSDFWGWTN